MRKLPRCCLTHSGAVLLQLKLTTTEIGAERPAENHRFILMCPIYCIFANSESLVRYELNTLMLGNVTPAQSYD
jgi:hypothetical protein